MANKGRTRGRIRCTKESKKRSVTILFSRSSRISFWLFRMFLVKPSARWLVSSRYDLLKDTLRTRGKSSLPKNRSVFTLYTCKVEMIFFECTFPSPLEATVKFINSPDLDLRLAERSNYDAQAC